MSAGVSGECVTPEVDPWTCKVREAIARSEYQCSHGSVLWLWYPVGKAPDRLHAEGNGHSCDFELVSTEEEQWPE